MYSNLNGEIKPGDNMNSTTHVPHTSHSEIGSETTLQHGQSMDSVNAAGEDEVGTSFYSLFLSLFLSWLYRIHQNLYLV